MMLFTDRKKAEEDYYRWIDEVSLQVEPEKSVIKDCPSNLFTWLLGDGKEWLKRMYEAVYVEGG